MLIRGGDVGQRRRCSSEEEMFIRGGHVDHRRKCSSEEEMLISQEGRIRDVKTSSKLSEMFASKRELSC